MFSKRTFCFKIICFEIKKYQNSGSIKLIQNLCVQKNNIRFTNNISIDEPSYLKNDFEKNIKYSVKLYFLEVI